MQGRAVTGDDDDRGCAGGRLVAGNVGGGGRGRGGRRGAVGPGGDRAGVWQGAWPCMRHVGGGELGCQALGGSRGAVEERQELMAACGERDGA